MPQPSDATAFPRMTTVPDKANTVILVDEKVAGNFITKGLPTSVLETALVGAGANGFQGGFDPTVPDPDLQNGTGTAGEWYRVSADGSHNFGAGSVALKTNQTVYYADDATWKLDAGGQFVTGDKTKLDALNSWEFSASDMANWASGAVVTETTTQAPGGFLYNVSDNSAGDSLFRQWTEQNLEPGSDYQWDFWFKTQTSPAHYMAFEVDNGEAATTITKVNLATAAVYEVTGGSIQVFATNWNINGGLYRVRFLIRPLKTQIVMKIYPAHGAAANAGNDTAVDITQQGSVDILPKEILRGLRDTSLLSTANVKAFGALGNGTTDDKTAIQNAINSGASRIEFPAGHYFCSGKLTVPVGVVELVATAPGSVRLRGDFGADPLLEIIGTTPTSLGGVTANLNKGDMSFTLNSAPSGILGGRDAAVIVDSGATLWSGYNSTYKKGEMPTINAVSGAVVYLAGELYDSYTQANVTVGQLHHRPLRIRNLMIENKEIGLLVKLCNDVVIENCHFETRNTAVGNASAACRIFQSANVRMINCTASVESDTSGTRYAVSVANSQNVWSVGGKYTSPRHALTHGGVGGSPTLANPMNPNRDIQVLGCELNATNFTGQTSTSPLDFHGNNEHCVISNCRINGAGIQIGGDKLAFNNVHVYLANQNIDNQGFRCSEMLGPNVSIANSSVHITNEATGYAFLFKPLNSNLTRDGVTTIDGLRIYTPGAGGGPYPIRFEQVAGDVPTANYLDIKLVNSTLINGGSQPPIFFRVDAPTAGDEVVRNIELANNTSDRADGYIDWFLGVTAYTGHLMQDNRERQHRSGYFLGTSTQTELWRVPTISDTIYFVTAKVVATRNTYALNEVRTFRVTAAFTNDAGALSQIGTTVTEIDLPQTSPPAVSIAFSVASPPKIQLLATSLASQTWFWNAEVEVMTQRT